MKFMFSLALATAISLSAKAQIDIEQLKLSDITCKVIRVEKGFEPQFYLGNVKIANVQTK